jgi:DNA-binding NtrC family response regulator/predicted ATPase
VEPLSELIGHSASIVAVREQVGRLLRTWSGARRPPPVLIQGETGTGKGLLARAIHRASPRASAPFVDINCAAVPETLLEAELFGYERGAFTDAKQSKPGLFLLAHRGTLFLDEVALMPPPLQAKLLSVLEERAVRRLGATRAEPVDVWVIAATNEDLAQALRARRFRDDLYHRLAVISLTLPPLRTRGEDIVLLAEHFLAGACRDYGVGQKTLTSDARGALVSYPWPGNIRELSNVIERAALLADTMTLDATHLGLASDAPGQGALASGEPSGAGAGTTALPVRSSRDAMHEHLERVLAQTGWNISRTATLLGVSRNTVMARIARFGLRGPRKAGGAAVSPPLDAVNAERAPVAPPRASPSPSVAHWERRRLTFVRVLFPARADGEVEPSVARHLDVAAEKLCAFGARLEDGGPALLLAVFGLDERDEPAVLAGHGALVVRNAARHGADDGDAPALRIGLHTAELFVRAGGAAPALDADGSREAWNAVATAMQLGSPGSIVATASAAALLRRRFALVPLGPEATLYRVDGLGRTDAIASASRTLFVGRREELALLQSRLAAAIEGRGQVVNLVAGAGMGKSRLMFELAASVRSGSVRYVEGHCMPAEVQTPFAPFLQILQTVCGIVESDGSETIAAKVAATLAQARVDDKLTRDNLVLLLDATSAPSSVSESSADRARLFAAIRSLLIGESRRRPLLLVVEDLHWVDPSSEACLGTLVESIGNAPIALFTSCRPTYRATWAGAPHALSLTLAPLSDEESRAVIRNVVPAGGGSITIEDDIKVRAEGNPLFLEELSHGVVGRQIGAADIPATIDEAIAGRLTRLGPRPRRVVSGLAVIGRDTPATVAKAVLDLPDDAFQAAVDQLRRAEFLHETSVDGEPGYAFRHALVQEVAYAHVAGAERRALHVRVLDTLERLYPDRGADLVERLAHHAVLGDAHERAVTYLLQAAEKAAGRTALAEALVHCERGLTLVPRLPEGAPRDRQDFALESARAQVLMATRGYAAPETERSYARARDLGQRVGDAVKLGPVLTGQWAQFLMKADYTRAYAVAEELRALAAQDETPLILATACRSIGMIEFFLGNFTKARAELEHAIRVYRPEDHRVRAVREYGGHLHPSCLAYLGRTLGHLGFADQARQRAEDAVAQAQQWSSPLGIAQVLGMLAAHHQMLRDVDATWEASDRALAYATSKGVAYWIVQSRILMAWARGMAEPASGLDTAIADIRHGIDGFRRTGTILGLAGYLTLLAELHAVGGRVPEALAILAEAEAHADATGERHLAVNMRRLRGELVLLRGAADAVTEAETCFRSAIEQARQRDAKTSELRVTTSLARLLQRRGRHDEARAVLAPLYAWFTEGFETVTMREARATLEGREP